MAFAPFKSNSNLHVRSISLPTKPHPLSNEIDEHLRRLEICETSTSSLSSFGSTLSSLEDVYECLDDLVQLPNTKQAYTRNEEWVEEMLDEHLMLLDLCFFAKDTLSQAKQDVVGLVSMLHRRIDSNKLARYLASRKKANEEILKSIKALRSTKSKRKENETMDFFGLFGKVEGTTINTLESLLTYIVGTRSQLKIKDLATKFILWKKPVIKNGEPTRNDFEVVDDEIKNLLNEKTCNDKRALSIQSLKSDLITMELNIQDLEEGLESLFKHLIRTRVSLLNVLN